MSIFSSSEEALKRAEEALQVSHSLTLLHHVLQEAAGQAFLHVLMTLTDGVSDALDIADAYSRAFRELAAAVSDDAVSDLADAWQQYLVTHLVDDSNVWSMLVERAGSASVGFMLRAQAQRDLRILQQFFYLDAEMMLQLTREAVAPMLPLLHDAWVPWHSLTMTETHAVPSARQALCRLLATSEDWGEQIPALESYWARHGTGPLARYAVLRWHGGQDGLHGVVQPDPIQLRSLIGCEREQEKLRTNTERFLAGLPAHDVLLYGAPGTGKSSTIKALVNAYAQQGLCLVEVRKEHIGDLPTIIGQLRGRAPHFLLFIDDLSFEEHETAYKVLKVLLEGTAEMRPANVLIYATTNRLNLVREHFADRGKPTEDVHWRDTMDEKQSLVHRFGLRITFALPDQAHYLHIVEELAQQRALNIGEELLRARALHWEHQHVGRSGRMARQFVDDLEAELRR